MSHEIGAPEGALRTATIKRRYVNTWLTGTCASWTSGRLNPTTDEQWQANDRTRAPGAQAGGSGVAVGKGARICGLLRGNGGVCLNGWFKRCDKSVE